jgi:hypothetical protein
MEKSKRKIIKFAIVALIAGGLYCLFFRSSLSTQELPKDLAYSGDSGGLMESEVVATLDEPVNGQKNVIWCGSFSLAWKKLTGDVVKEPIRLAKGNETAERLNQVPLQETDLAADSYYAAAGWVKDGIVDTILQQMAKRFPDFKPTIRVEPEDRIVAYAYLEASVTFKLPFQQYEKSVSFKNTDGSRTAIKAFGLWKEDSKLKKIREQVDILYQSKEKQPEEYILDLSRETKPYQLILASVPFQSGLRETVEYVKNKIQQSHSENLHENDKLLVPDIAWKISHHFQELEGEDKVILNKGFEGLFIGKACQEIEFNLNRKGATLKSFALSKIESPPKELFFDHPFLLMMRMRGKAEPIFVMWVANSELLRKWSK